MSHIEIFLFFLTFFSDRLDLQVVLVLIKNYLLLHFFDDSVKNIASTQRPRFDAILLTK